ncbi:MAG: S8 family peptidase [Bdellovibrionota bacterium]
MRKKIILGIALFLTQKNYAAINKNAYYNLNIKNNHVVIAIIDTGADVKHNDLKKFIWINSGESGVDALGQDKATNLIDDDDNGFVDDLHGWNFVDNNNDVSDLHGHGTHITGIIKKEFQKHSANFTSEASARLMILKYYDPNASDTKNILNTTKALNYAVKMQARIINYSGGGGSRYAPEYQAIAEAAKKNTLLVAAAGNNNSNTDNQQYYPANYALDNIISVAATDNSGELESFSNYGHNSIDIAAPGKLIYSTLPKNTYGIMSGTSQATAYVTGVAASLLIVKTALKPKEILVDLLTRCKFNKSLKGKTKFQLAMVQ